MATLTKPADGPGAGADEPKSPPTLRRLWLRWVLLVVFVAVLGTVFVNLGEWQLDRLHQRQARNATTVANEHAAVRPYAEVFDHPIADADTWQRVQATGTFDAGHQFVVRYRNNGDDSGYEILTPLQTSTGAVLVSRGFVTLPGGQQIPTAAPAPPSGQVHVVGYVQRSENGRKGAIVPNGNQVRLINSAALQPAIPYPIADGYISAITVDPPQSGDFQPLVLPEISNGPHFWYAVQWFMFTGIGIAGIVVFIRGDLKDRRLAREAAARAKAPGAPPPPPGANNAG
ncbi:SURF1 family cytochrome oxidase biogenesis protein [Microlunatus ginsengisoli]|uniref:SURF1-like protein n=1 Tax=Microlunatus ginsengisoli TaxID=363863 RepID=A0ABP7A867_9ACTN